jgi:hypothetical protein
MSQRQIFIITSNGKEINKEGKKERERKQTREQVTSPAQSTLFRYETDLSVWVLLRVVGTF